MRPYGGVTAPTRSDTISSALPSGVSVVVPVYRAQGTIGELYRRLTDVLGDLGAPYELVFVEDAGGDGSWGEIQRLACADARVRGLQMSRNYGQHNAVLLGLRVARFDRTVTIDDDLQNPPEEIPKLLAALVDGIDVVYGTPDQERHGFLRNQASRFTKLALQSVMGAETARHVSAFRALRTGLREAFATYRSPFVVFDVLLTWGTNRFAHTRVRHDERRQGRSNYTVRALVSHAINLLTGFSTLPLQIASLVGFVFTVFGMLVLAYVVGSFVANGGSVPGFAFLASIVAIFSGAQLFALGIIGEYLARVHFRSMDRPTYFVRGTTADPPSSSVEDDR